MSASGVRFVPRPISALVIAFVAIPGILTGLGLTFAAVAGHETFPPARLLLGAMGLTFLAFCVLFLFSSSGLHLDPGARTVTLCVRVLGWRMRPRPIPVHPDDRVHVETMVSRARPPYPRMQNSCVVLIGGAGRRFLIGTRTRAESESVARVIAEVMRIPSS